MKDHPNTPKEALELERSGSGKASLPQYDSEIPAIPQRRRFKKEYKLQIIKELDRCKISGGKGLILRREGLYSSQVAQWKAQMVMSKKKPKNNSDKNELARLKRENQRLKIKLEKSEKLIEIQKKMAKIMEELADNENASE